MNLYGCADKLPTVNPWSVYGVRFAIVTVVSSLEFASTEKIVYPTDVQCICLAMERIIVAGPLFQKSMGLRSPSRLIISPTQSTTFHVIGRRFDIA